MKHKIIFIEGTQSFINQAIVNKLEEADFDVIRLPDDLDIIAANRNEAEMLLYYPALNNDRVGLITKYLIGLCRDNHKTLCIVGEPHNIAEAKKAEESERIYAVYERPVDINQLVEDMKALIDTHKEYKRMKNILVIDDDNDFLTVMHNWLKYNYKVDGVRSGPEAILYLENMRPDLILLDYAMPGIDGYQVLDQIRKNPLTARIPVIFLTGNNDRDSVMRIIKRKPDGYLLKSMKKEELLDALERFFADSILTQKTLRYQ